MRNKEVIVTCKRNGVSVKITVESESYQQMYLEYDELVKAASDYTALEVAVRKIVEVNHGQA